MEFHVFCCKVMKDNLKKTKVKEIKALKAVEAI